MRSSDPVRAIAAAGLAEELRDLGVNRGDGLFVHASLRSIGPVSGGAAAVVRALLETTGPQGLLAMPGFSGDACLPPGVSPADKPAAEAAVPGFDPARSPAHGMGAIAETFRQMPGTLRSSHPAVSVCAQGADAASLLERHSLAWATGAGTPFGRMMRRPEMKILLIGVGWNRCTALHTAEYFARPRRVKTRRFKTGPGSAPWMETPDVADDMERLFPAAGSAFEKTGRVSKGEIGQAECRICRFEELVSFASRWIGAANSATGMRH